MPDSDKIESTVAKPHQTKLLELRGNSRQRAKHKIILRKERGESLFFFEQNMYASNASDQDSGSEQRLKQTG